MSDSAPLLVTPPSAIEGGRISLLGSDLSSAATPPVVSIDGQAARVTFVSSRRLDVIVPPLSGESPASVTVRGLPVHGTLRVGAAVATGLHQVDSPVVDDEGSLYVTYSGTRGQQVPVSIFRIRPNGTRETFSASIANPTSMALDPEGRLFVSSRFEGAVYRVTPDGQAERFAGDLGTACGLAFAPDGTLFVGDRSGTVFAVDRQGRARTLATLPSSVAAFHLALRGEALFVTAPTLSTSDPVFRVSLDGRVDVVSRGFGRPQGLAVGPDGVLYVVDALAGASGLYAVTDGAPPRLVLAASGLIGVTFDRSGRQFVCTADTVFRLPAA